MTYLVNEDIGPAKKRKRLQQFEKQSLLFEHAEMQTAKQDVFEDLRGNPRMSITGVANDDSPCSVVPRSVTVGPDWLKVWIYGAPCADGLTSVVVAEFERLQRECVKGNDSSGTLGERDIVVRRSGLRGGANSLEYGCAAGSIDVYVADVNKPGRAEDCKEGKRPIALIEVRGRACYGLGLLDLRDEIDLICMDLGIVVQKVQLSRLDIAVDVTGHSVLEAEKLRILGGVVTRGRDCQINVKNGVTTGVSWGAPKSHVRCVIYDKVLELESDTDKKERFVRAYGELPEVLTRYEFRLDRDALLKRHDIDTLDDLCDKFASLVRYLTTDWYRETVPSDLPPQLRELTSAWAEISELCVSRFSLRSIRAPRKEGVPDVSALMIQAAGCLTSAVAMSNTICSEAKDVLGAVFSDFQPALESALEKCEDKRVQYLAKYGALVGANICSDDSRSTMVEFVQGLLTSRGKIDVVPF